MSKIQRLTPPLLSLALLHFLRLHSIVVMFFFFCSPFFFWPFERLVHSFPHKIFYQRIFFGSTKYTHHHVPLFVFGIFRRRTSWRRASME